MILGADISTSITGITILNDAGDIVLCEAIDTRNKNHFPSHFHKAQKVRQRLLEIKEQYDIKNVFIEQSLQSFRSGFSSAKTLSTLASFNGIVSWFCFQIWGDVPEYLAATSARKTCGITIKRGVKAKKIVMEHLLATEEDFSIEYTRQGNPKPHEFDRADSLVIARAGHYLVKRR